MPGDATPPLCMDPNCPNAQSSHFHVEVKPDSMQDEAQQADQDDLTGKQQDMYRQLTGITDWWAKTAMADAERTIPKAIEYGSADFDLMGQFMVALIGDKLNGATDDEKLRVGREMAVTFYLIGKLGRMVGAFATGVLPSDDTLFDTTIYSMMLRRIRQTGHWVE